RASRSCPGRFCLALRAATARRRVRAEAEAARGGGRGGPRRRPRRPAAEAEAARGGGRGGPPGGGRGGPRAEAEARVAAAVGPAAGSPSRGGLEVARQLAEARIVAQVEEVRVEAALVLAAAEEPVELLLHLVLLAGQLAQRDQAGEQVDGALRAADARVGGGQVVGGVHVVGIGQERGDEPVHRLLEQALPVDLGGVAAAGPLEELEALAGQVLRLGDAALLVAERRRPGARGVRPAVGARLGRRIRDRARLRTQRRRGRPHLAAAAAGPEREAGRRERERRGQRAGAGPAARAPRIRSARSI